MEKLIDAVYNNPRLRNSLGLGGTVTFESHTNLGAAEETTIALGETTTAVGETTTAVEETHRKAKGKGNRADQFCIYRKLDGTDIPATAIEYKAPHKLTQDEIITGLASEIQPERDVINKDGSGFVFASKSLAAAVVTQLFSYLIGKGIQYGYVCTGQAFTFLYIPDDPSIVYCVPNLDVLDDDENRLHRTAVAQVFAFTLQALRTAPLPLSWRDAAAHLDTWAVEYDDVLSKVPVSVRKNTENRASPYKPQKWRGFKRSPIRTRAYCKQPDANPIFQDNNESDDGGAGPPSPTPARSTRSGRRTVVSSTSSRGKRGGQRGKAGQQQSEATHERIQDRPYCTHRCILTLAYGGAMDETCPNAHNHGSRHIDRGEFLRLLRAQLAEDRGPDADSTPLYLSGSIGSLFKVRLSAYGYTLVAKGVETAVYPLLQHENQIYDRARDIQGKHTPVCLGIIDLVLPYYYDSGVFKHFLLLSWAGQSLNRCIEQVDKTLAIETITKAFVQLHQLRILHGDAEPRNILYDTSNGNFMVIDFERAEFRSHHQPLTLISPNNSRKRKRGISQKEAKDDFKTEKQSVVGSVLRCFHVYESNLKNIARRNAGASPSGFKLRN